MHNYILKLLSAMSVLGYSIFIGVVLPNQIGVIAFGEYSYVIATITFFLQLLLLETNASFMGLYKSNNNISKAYFYFIIIISFIIALSVFISVKIPIINSSLWFGIDSNLVIFIAILATLIFVQTRITEYTDFIGRVAWNEIVKLLSKIILVTVLLFLVYYSFLDLISFLYVAIFINILYVLLFLRKFVAVSRENVVDVKEAVSSIFQLLFYSRFLIPIAIFTAVNTYLGKFILQNNTGSKEQGFYAVALSLSLIPISILTSFSGLITKKMIDAGEIEKVYLFWHRIFSFFHFFWFSFIFLFADRIILTIYDESYLGAKNSLVVLSFFSFIHTNSILNRCLLISYGKSKLYSQVNNISIFISMLCLIIYDSYYEINAFSLALIVTVFFFLRVVLMKLLYSRYLQIFTMKYFIQTFVMYGAIFCSVYIIQCQIGNFWLAISVMSFVSLLFSYVFLYKSTLLSKTKGIAM